MIITIHCPEGREHEYVQEVAIQLDAGFDQGYVDRNTWWEITDDAPNDAESLGDVFTT